MTDPLVAYPLITFLVGFALQPYASLVFEWWTTRPRRISQPNYFDHCKGCTL
jgi:hypothetical protein